MLGQKNNLRFFRAITIIGAPLSLISFWIQKDIPEQAGLPKAIWVALTFLGLIGFLMGYLMWRVYLPEQYQRENQENKKAVA